MINSAAKYKSSFGLSPKWSMIIKIKKSSRIKMWEKLLEYYNGQTQAIIF